MTALSKLKLPERRQRNHSSTFKPCKVLALQNYSILEGTSSPELFYSRRIKSVCFIDKNNFNVINQTVVILA